MCSNFFYTNPLEVGTRPKFTLIANDCPLKTIAHYLPGHVTCVPLVNQRAQRQKKQAQIPGDINNTDSTSKV
jgi:hypothetical protein